MKAEEIKHARLASIPLAFPSSLFVTSDIVFMPVAIGEFQRNTPKVLIEIPLNDVGVGEFTACSHLCALLYPGSFPVVDLAAAVGAGAAAETA
jgi:hypothetical protein